MTLAWDLLLLWTGQSTQPSFSKQPNSELPGLYGAITQLRQMALNRFRAKAEEEAAPIKWQSVLSSIKLPSSSIYLNIMQIFYVRMWWITSGRVRVWRILYHNHLRAEVFSSPSFPIDSLLPQLDESCQLTHEFSSRFAGTCSIIRVLTNLRHTTFNFKCVY